MYYEGLELLRTPVLPSGKIYIVKDDDNFLSSNKDEIASTVNSVTKDYAEMALEFVSTASVSDEDLRFILSKQYNMPDSQIPALVEKAREVVSCDFWKILRDDEIEFEGPDLDIYNAMTVVAVYPGIYRLFRFGLHSISDAKDLGRLIFNEYDYMVRPDTFGFQGFSGFPSERRVKTKASPNVGVPIDAKSKAVLDEKIASIVDTIQSMDRDEGISWLSRVIGDRMIDSLELPQSQPSAIRVDDEMRLLLTDRGNAEVKIDPLTKAYYYLHLINMDGVSACHHDLYVAQMLEVYKTVSNRTDVDKMEMSVKNILYPGSELLPQKISRLRRSLLEYFPRTVVEDYYMPKYCDSTSLYMMRIGLDPDKVSVTSMLDGARKIKVRLPKAKPLKNQNSDIQYVEEPTEVHYDDKPKGHDIYMLD